MNKILKTMREYFKTYFPKEYERRKVAKMSPKELGEYLAKNFVIKLVK